MSVTTSHPSATRPAGAAAGIPDVTWSAPPLDLYGDRAWLPFDRATIRGFLAAHATAPPGARDRKAPQRVGPRRGNPR